jgi:hypothetical protein
MKTFRYIGWIIALVCGLEANALESRHGYVLEQELQGFGDFDGDSDLDVFVVTRDSGAVRVGYQNGSGDLEWGAIFYSGVENASSMSSGRLLSSAADAIAVTGNSANRVSMLALDPGSLYSAPFNVFASGIGTSSVAAVDIALGGSPANMHDLVIVSPWNEPATPDKSHLINVKTGSATESVVETNAAVHERGRRVLPVPGGATSYGVFERGATSDTFRLFHLETVASLATSFTEVSGLGTESQSLEAAFSGSRSEFVFYSQGADTIGVSQADAFGVLGAITKYTIGRDIDRIFLILSGGKPGLFITYDRGEEGGIYSFDGVSAPKLLQSIEAPLGEKITGMLGYGDGEFALLTGSFRGGHSTKSQRYSHDGSAWLPGAVAELPAGASGGGASLANVFVWNAEPLVTNGAQVVDILRAADWTSVASIDGTGSLSVEGHTFDSLTSGLSGATKFNLGKAATTAFAAPNQTRSDSSIVSEGVPLGAGMPSISISPSPGEYEEYITPVLIGNSTLQAFYRDGNGTAWRSFDLTDPNARIRLSGGTLRPVLVSYYAEDSAGKRSPIFTARYTFVGEPGSIDSDSDGVPDFVELDAGLNPALGADSDRRADPSLSGDGFSDLEELLHGTDPTQNESRSFTLPDGSPLNVSWPPSRTTDSDGDGFDDYTEFVSGTDLADPASFPTDADAVHWQNVFEVAAKPLSITDAKNGAANVESFADSSGTQGTLVSAYGLDGQFLGSARTDHNGIPGLGDPTAYLQKIPGDARNLFVVVATEATFETKEGDPGVGHGRELLALVPVPQMQVGEIDYSYTGMTPALEAAAWLAAAKAHYLALEPPLTTLRLDYLDTLGLLLAEKVVAHFLDSDGITFTSFRDLENEPTTASDAELLALKNYTDDATSAYLLQVVYAEIEKFVDSSTEPSILALKKLANDIYRLSSYDGADDPGLYPSPVDTLRDIISSMTESGSGKIALPGSESSSSYDAGHTLTADELVSAVKTLGDLLTALSPRPVEDFRVRVTFDGAFEVETARTPIEFFEADGSPYRFPDSLELPPGSILDVKAFTDRVFATEPGTDGVEVIEVELFSVPVPPPSDRNRDMMPDEWAAYFFSGVETGPFDDADGDGYSNLQEFLESTDPTSFSDRPEATVPRVDLSPPELDIELDRPDHLIVSFEFPAAYADQIGFGLLIQTDLRRFFLEVDETAAEEGTGSYSLRIRQPSDPATWYRFEMFLK